MELSSCGARNLAITSLQPGKSHNSDAMELGRKGLGGMQIGFENFYFSMTGN